MSVDTLLQGGLERNLPLNITALTVTDLYTTGDNFSSLASVAITNNSSLACEVELFHYDVDTNVETIYAVDVPAFSTHMAECPMRLLLTEKVQIQVETINVITALPQIIKYAPNETPHAGKFSTNN